MASLAQVTKDLRTGLKYGGIGIAILTVIFIFIQGIIFLKETFFPSAPPPPKQEFGVLPHIIENSPDAVGIQYRINTVNGVLPTLPDRANVYKLQQNEPDFLALNTAKSTLRSANFTSDPIKITDTIYQWIQNSSGVNIQYDIVSHNFTISSDYLSNSNLASTGLMPTPAKIKNDIEIFLKNIGQNTTDIDFLNSEVILYELIDSRLVEAQNLGSARFARVNLQQKPIEDIQISYISPKESVMSFVVSYPGTNFTIVDGQFYHYIPDTEQKSDYGIKTVDQAYVDLQNGEAEIFNPTAKSVIDITDVQLRYYLNKTTNMYLQPIIVFSGIDFTAYVDAIPPPLPSITPTGDE